MYKREYRNKSEIDSYQNCPREEKMELIRHTLRKKVKMKENKTTQKKNPIRIGRKRAKIIEMVSNAFKSVPVSA